MSEFFEPGAGISSHLRGVSSQVEALHAREDIPQGAHIDRVLGMADIGGEYGAAYLIGDQGSGKTTLATIIEGSKSVIDIGEFETPETLLGTEKQMADGYTSGRIGGLILRNNGDVEIVLDEVGHLENARPLHRLFNGTGFKLQDGNVEVDSSAMSLIATSNYPNRLGGVYPMHKELRDRFGGGLALGSDLEVPRTRRPEPGLVAPTKVRQDLRAYLEERYPIDNESVKSFTKAIIHGMAETGMFEVDYIPKGARPIGGLAQAVRAGKLVTVQFDSEERKLRMGKAQRITALDIPEVAAFTLGHRAELTRDAEYVFSGALGGEPLTEHAKAVIKHRMIAGIAEKIKLTGTDPIALAETLKAQGKTIEDWVKQNMDVNSYATLDEDLMTKVGGISKIDLIDQKILDVIFKRTTPKNTIKEQSNEKSGIKGILARQRAKKS